MELPKEPERGDRITADWARRVARALRALRLTAGPGIRIHAGPDGTTVSAALAKRAGAEGGAVLALVRGDSAMGATADVYSLDSQTVIRRNAFVCPVEGALSSTSPAVVPSNANMFLAFPVNRLAAPLRTS